MLRFAKALSGFWEDRGYWGERRQWLEQALRETSKASPALRARVLVRAGMFVRQQGDFRQAVAHYEESLALYKELGDTGGMARPLARLAIVAYRQGDYRRAAGEAPAREKPGGYF